MKQIPNELDSNTDKITNDLLVIMPEVLNDSWMGAIS